MSNNKSPYAGLLNAGNDQYNGLKSVEEHGALAHANGLAIVFLREGKAATETEALAMANHEIQRLAWYAEGLQPHRTVRKELAAETKRRARAASRQFNASA